MHTRMLSLLVAPLLLLAAGCEDELTTAPPEALFSTAEGEAVTYQAIELGGLMTGTHGWSRANALHSDLGGDAVVVGSAHYVGDEKAVLWRVSENGDVSGPERLGELTDPVVTGYTYQLARDINSAGVIVGEVLYRDGGTINPNLTVGFLFDGEMNLLPWFVGDTQQWFAWEINDDGMVVGAIRYVERDEDGNTTNTVRGALWLAPYEAEPVLLDPLPAHELSQARTINNDGTIAGLSYTGADSVGVYWVADVSGSISGPYELAPGFRSTALNSTGYVAGQALGEAAVWDPNSSSLLQLGTLDSNKYSHAFGINNTDGGAFQIVGWSGRSGDNQDWLPTVWNTADGSTDGPLEIALPRGYTGGYASDVDEREWIVGVGFEKQRNQSVWQALLWQPQETVGDGDDDGGDGGDEDPCKPHPRTGECR